MDFDHLGSARRKMQKEGLVIATTLSLKCIKK